MDVYVSFGGSDPDRAELARAALQPVLDSIYRRYNGEPQADIEHVLRRAGRGAFARDNIEIFAQYIAYGDRPVLTDWSTAGFRAPRTSNVVLAQRKMQS